VRSIYILSGRPVAKLESGFMVDSRGKTVGMDLWVEVKPNEWVPASQLPPGTLSTLKDTGQLQHGIYYQGKLYTELQVENTLHKLIAAKEGLEKAFKEKQSEIKAATSFKAFQEQIGNPLDRLIRQLEHVKQQIEELKTLESEERRAKLESLEARTQRLMRKATELQKDKEPEAKPLIKPEDVQPTEHDWLWDVLRAWKGKALTTQSLELLAKAQRISELAGEDLLLNPERMKALRELLIS